MLPADFHYERFAPGPALAPYVEHFWIVNATLGPVRRREILVPDGRPMVLVCLGDPGTRIDPDTGVGTANDSALVGIETGPVVLEQTGLSRYVCAALTPYGLAGFGIAPLVGRRAPMPWPVDPVAAAPFGVPAVRALESVLESHLAPLEPGRLDRLARAVTAIGEAEGRLEVEDLCETLGLSYDRLYRDFRAHVGITPKQLIAITRYQRLVGGLLMERPGQGLAQLALMRGYYDQAHANRDFRRFTGTTPTRFRLSLNGIARLMHER